MRGLQVASQDGRDPGAKPLDDVRRPDSICPDGGGEPTDRELVSRAAGGDGEAFVALFESYKGFVYAMCVKILRRVEDAEDCSQEVWVRIQRALGSYEGRSSVRTWIGSIAANRARDMLRERDRFRRVLEAAMQIHRWETSLARAVEPEVQHGSVIEAMKSLDDLERRIVELRLQDETLTLEELGERLGLPRHKVKYAWGKARESLKQRLTEWSMADRLLLALLVNAAATSGIWEVFRG